MALRNDLPRLIEYLAKEDGHSIEVKVAAANGARLVETAQIPELKELVSKNWDLIVLQDFTKTPLRSVDRFGRKWAINSIADEAPDAAILLYPPPPAREEALIYENAGFLTDEPTNPDDLAQRTNEFYESIGFMKAPVPDAWQYTIKSGADLYEADGHHPNKEGSDVIARTLWNNIKEVLF